MNQSIMNGVLCLGNGETHFVFCCILLTSFLNLFLAGPMSNRLAHVYIYVFETKTVLFQASFRYSGQV
jgi:hypothetical protein